VEIVGLFECDNLWKGVSMATRSTFSFALSLAATMCAYLSTAAPAPLQTFTVKDYLQHQWTDELVHFPISYSGTTLPKSLTLTDAEGKPVPCQISGLARKGGKITGTVWTVVTLPPKGSATFHLQPGKPVATPLLLRVQGNEYLLGNEFLAFRLPRLPGALKQPVNITSLPAPLLAVSGPGGKNWLGQGAWAIDADQPLTVKEAITTVVEQGPVRVTVRYRLVFTDGRSYQADIMLGDRQDVALFTDDTDVEAPKTTFRFALPPGLRADRLFWQNNYWADSYKGLTGDPIVFEKEKVICNVCPWSFWWQQDRTTWAGLYRDDADPFLGILAVRPSRWTPIGWDGFDRTLIPITARAGGQVDVSLGLLAWMKKKEDGSTELFRAHRELAFTMGRADDFLDKKRMTILKEAEAARQRQDNNAWNRLLGEGMWRFKLRRQLIQYSEFPLDEVKDYGFDFKSAVRDRKHPYLLFTQSDIDRARQQAKANPGLKAELAKATGYITRLNPDALIAKIQKEPDGWQAYFRENYVGNGMYEVAPTAYIGSEDPRYGQLLAAGVKGLATQVADQFLNNPSRPTLGGNAHMAATTLLRLLLAYDTLADSGYLTPEDKSQIDAVLVFGGYVFDHPDYWNTDVGLCSANPNMTSLLKFPLGLVGLYLDGHPRAAHWLKFAETELQTELKDCIAPGGAWLECPFYQDPSLDGMFMLSQALRNVRGKDYFSEPQFKATMDYYGFLLTPPEVRFPTKIEGVQAPMTIPSIGDAFPYFTTPFNGWMAYATAKSDPAFSARQQFYWQQQAFSVINGGRANAFMAAICDTELPVAPPTKLSRAFEGFGNILRSSWTDPKGSYVAHRCGYFTHHFDPGDPNTIIYYAKGAPLCVDFGHRGASAPEVETMWRPDYHTTVSFDRPAPHHYWGASVGPKDANKQRQEVRSLPRTIDYSTGVSFGSGNQMNNRHLLLIKSEDAMGATYVVMRDITKDGQPNQSFNWNLWCMAKEPEVIGNVAHFPGQFGVDLDAHVLSPANPQFVKDKYGYEQWVWPWWDRGKLREDQTGVHVRKTGSQEDFFTVLYPRAPGQEPAQVTAIGDGRGVELTHIEGKDVVLLSPGEAATVTSGAMRLEGETAFARRYQDGALRLAVVQGRCVASIGDWALSGNGPAAIEVKGKQIIGECDGDARVATIALPMAYGTAVVTLDGKRVAAVAAAQEQRILSLDFPKGRHAFTVSGK